MLKAKKKVRQVRVEQGSGRGKENEETRQRRKHQATSTQGQALNTDTSARDPVLRNPSFVQYPRYVCQALS